MADADLQRWEKKYAGQTAADSVSPDPWLVRCCSQVPQPTGPGQRRALELACGTGANAVWLAQQGWFVDAVDISPRALELTLQLAESSSVSVNTITADLDDWTPDSRVYDLISVFRFLDRRSLPRIVSAGLKPGGWLVFETFSQQHLRRDDNHLRNPEFTLHADEPRAMFPDLDVIEGGIEVLADRTVGRYFARSPVNG